MESYLTKDPEGFLKNLREPYLTEEGEDPLLIAAKVSLDLLKRVVRTLASYGYLPSEDRCERVFRAGLETARKRGDVREYLKFAIDEQGWTVDRFDTNGVPEKDYGPIVLLKRAINKTRNDD